MSSFPTADTMKTAGSGSDGVDLPRQMRMLWAGRIWILFGTAICVLVGLAYAFLAKPAYLSSATIALKEAKTQSAASSMLSQLGGLGGMVAAQLGGANTNLDKLEVILTGEELALSVIEKDSLLPILFPGAWDSARGDWKGKAPNPRDAADFLIHDVLSVSVDRLRHFLDIRMTASDPMVAKNLVDNYLEALGRKLQDDARQESKTNQDFLAAQVQKTSDPIIREKILTMIAMEIEKEMLVGSQAIEILKRPAVPMYREFPKRKKIVVLSFMVGFGLSATLVLAYPVIRRLAASAA